MAGIWPSGSSYQVEPDNVKRVTWNVEDKEMDERQHKSLNLRKQLKSVKCGLAQTQADVDILKREHSNMVVILQQLLGQVGSEGETLKVQFVAAHDSQDDGNEYQLAETATQDYTADIDELKTWVASKVDVWEKFENQQSFALGEAMRAVDKLRVDTDNTQKKLAALTCAVRQDRETVEIVFKHSLEDLGFELKSHMRNQIATINAELRRQKNALDQEKDARDTNYKYLSSLVGLNSTNQQPRQIKRAYEANPPAMDNVAKKVAHLACELEAEVAARAAKMKMFRQPSSDIPSISHAFPSHKKSFDSSCA